MTGTGATRSEFCTLFDANYLPRGLVLYRSLAAVTDRFQLRVYCMDDRAYRLLRALDLPNLEPIALSELERDDAELLSVKPTRDPVEYCWTATPAVCLHALERDPSIQSITYLDADLMFFSDPAQLFEELGESSICLVPHGYAEPYRYLEELSGTYNVEWLTFRRTDDGLRALRWWRDRCIEWCYRRHEDGKFGDQKYLDDWPQRFPGVRVLSHPGAGLAPWNVPAHELALRDGRVLVDGRPLVFFHHHALRLYSGITTLRRAGVLADSYRLHAGLVWDTDYAITDDERRLVWEPYIEALAGAVRDLRRIEPRFDAGFVRVPPGRAVYQAVRAGVPRPLRSTLRRVRRLVA